MPGWGRRSKKPPFLIRCAIALATPATNTERCAPIRAEGVAMLERIAVFGGVYSNHLALDAALRDIRRRGVEAVYCLGDLGAFGPYPDRVFPLLHEYGVRC